jgi:hypothetical protein
MAGWRWGCRQPERQAAGLQQPKYARWGTCRASPPSPPSPLPCLRAGKQVKATFGTTKYCNAFLKGVHCGNPECLYLHDVGEPPSSPPYPFP